MTTTPAMVGLIAEGMTRSPTFASLAEQLLESNVLATVEPLYRIKTGLNGYLVFVTSTMFRRYVRIYVDGRLYREQQIAILGHELRHALEVAGHPEVVDQASLRRMYRVIGHNRKEHYEEAEQWESEAAIAAGQIIRHELQNPIVAVAIDR